MKDYILEHYKRYPEMEIQDMVKLIYQNEFGPGHMIQDQAASLMRLQQEWESGSKRGGSGHQEFPLFEPLGNGLCRLHLDGAGQWFCPDTVNRFFVETAREVHGNREEFENKLTLFLTLCRDRVLPYGESEAAEYIRQYKTEGYPAVSHSSRYRETYHPSYRVVSEEYRKYWQVFSRIDKEKPEIVAIDGKSGSGKSRLGSLLGRVYDCNLFHMDDFFLRPEQRTEERLSEVGGNVDYERFFEQVVAPLLNHTPEFSYQVYDCSVQKLTKVVPVTSKPLAMVEGSYSCHPCLQKAYDLKIFLDVDSQTQKERIRLRNGDWMLSRFIEEWIPKENSYFEKFGIRETCDIRY